LTYSVAVLSVAAALVAGCCSTIFCKLIRFVSLFLCAINVRCMSGGIARVARDRAFHFGIRLLFRAAYQFVRRGIQGHTAHCPVCNPALFLFRLSAAKESAAESLRPRADDLQTAVQELARLNNTLG